MIPRVFVSSTYYDLRHVRERIEQFIDNYGFEPILFESDKVIYQPGKEIDYSAYIEVGLCHIMVLIVGGRYGSPSSLSNQEEERKKYDEDYISITRKEFEIAIQKNIPILIFIDKNVYGEFLTYKENQEHFEELSLLKGKDRKKFKFAHVDHINVFRFVDILRVKPIKTFEKVEEIESYIKSQLSGMFYLYLESLKKESDDNKILDTISELNNVTLRMNAMLTSVGKEILGEDKKEYEKVIQSQFEIMVDFFGEKLLSSIAFESVLDDEVLNKIDIDLVSSIIYVDALKTTIPLSDNTKSYSEWHKLDFAARMKIFNNVQAKLLMINQRLRIKNFNLKNLNQDFHEKVLPFIKNQDDESKIIEKIKSVIRELLTEPF